MSKMKAQERPHLHDATQTTHLYSLAVLPAHLTCSNIQIGTQTSPPLHLDVNPHAIKIP